MLTLYTCRLCLCGDSIGDLSSLKKDDSACNNPCRGDVSLGFCGYMDADNSYANIYAVCSDRQSCGVPATAPATIPIEVLSITIQPLHSPCESSAASVVSSTSLCSDDLEIPAFGTSGPSTPHGSTTAMTTESAQGLGLGSSSSTTIPPGEYGLTSTSSPCSNDLSSGTTFIVVVSPDLPSTSTPCSTELFSSVSMSNSQPLTVYPIVPAPTTPSYDAPSPMTSEGSLTIPPYGGQNPTSSTTIASPTSFTAPEEPVPTTSGPAIITAGGSLHSYNFWAGTLAAIIAVAQL
ncbi:hypothetical protein VD0002_g126 [Verticillium dahliae]|uniref:WSC domain-containing protein n=1 Tax=Verticillium dahliae TaxID=27337 RepID=A0AA45AHD9_VERDA|nr:hypothetical protein BJF96_g9923 [Verticillium dahliae]PNH56657.1 hypothetical protein VD0003_g1082 [Verticillium dahliae]PNH70635.1 hypothetical protein VD0002_g126 [Verticillium dahliae]